MIPQILVCRPQVHTTSRTAALCVLLFVLTLCQLVVPSTANTASIEWEEVASAEDIQTALASASDASFLRVAALVPRYRPRRPYLQSHTPYVAQVTNVFINMTVFRFVYALV